MSEQEKGVSSVVFTIVICFIILLIFMGAAYVVISDKINGHDAYRTKALRDQRDGYKSVCEDNYRTSGVLREWLNQQGLKAPPEFLVQKPCQQPESVEENQK